MKTIKVPIEVAVPISICARCREEKQAELRAQLSQDGHIHLRIVSHFTPLVVGGRAAMLCPNCAKFIVGALEAAGVQFPMEPPAS